jgi:hypothetical protein
MVEVYDTVEKSDIKAALANDQSHFWIGKLLAWENRNLALWLGFRFNPILSEDPVAIKV